MNDASTTRRYYQFDEQVPVEPALLRTRNMAYLQRLAARVWGRYGQQRPRPRVVAGRGLATARGLTSYFDTVINTVVLARDQRCVHILLHELSHALTPKAKLMHGPAFGAMYLTLMAEFGREDPGYLELHLIDRRLIR